MSEQLLDKRLNEFLNELASKAPTPGGGSVAAVTGAMAAGLLVMVCDLTIGKKQYADFEAEAQAIRERAESLRLELQELAQRDIDVFERLSSAYKLPRTTDADSANRRAAIQTVTKQATEIPLQTGRAIAKLLVLCPALAQSGSRLVVSDVGVAAALIQSAVPAALLNVEINLVSLEDTLFVQETRAHMKDLTMGINEEVADVLKIVGERIAN
ncbi:MAG: formiminotransferase-cyclodeaminase [Chloroflexi bacterium AL-W]|nr:formiminotransferase-cyclodeaminase [Chloroflexi bacterium AL-N1]NOK69847.1 formiminotransferase-cyclodeaminase [Chloroflexi bacterium AL-N10]NOK73549.1 formiminotransferase-cyclodeaminase [Chloroflexi bacterium AL-N5]NOK84017.1 formiminotransferase-cyclodeaminase [Chloroflexi bacterium AL-W]NOK87880.1 formiminotransferase-cyclodeaminase [Chloroflexi bacterium AL-N15]